MLYSKVIKLSANKQFYCELVSESLLQNDQILASVYMILANDCDKQLKDCTISDLGDSNG